MSVDPTPLAEKQRTVPRSELTSERFSNGDEDTLGDNATIGDEIAEKFDL